MYILSAKKIGMKYIVEIEVCTYVTGLGKIHSCQCWRLVSIRVCNTYEIVGWMNLLFFYLKILLLLCKNLHCQNWFFHWLHSNSRYESLWTGFLLFLNVLSYDIGHVHEKKPVKITSGFKRWLISEPLMNSTYIFTWTCSLFVLILRKWKKLK